MRTRHVLVAALVLYVTLDLSLPAMPGAFVFAPDDSVESIGVARSVSRTVAAPEPPGGTPSLRRRPDPGPRALARLRRSRVPFDRPTLRVRTRLLTEPRPGDDEPH